MIKFNILRSDSSWDEQDTKDMVNCEAEITSALAKYGCLLIAQELRENGHLMQTQIVAVKNKAIIKT